MVYSLSMKSCFNCKTTDNLTIDHIFPKKWGGLNISENRMLLCRPCHDYKEKNTVRHIKADGIIRILTPFIVGSFENPAKGSRHFFNREQPHIYNKKKIKKPKKVNKADEFYYNIIYN